MKKSGVDNIDKELSGLESNFQTLIKSFELLNKKERVHNEAKKLKSSITNFRYKLGYNRGTEHYETKYDWASDFKKMFDKLDKVIESTKDG